MPRSVVDKELNLSGRQHARECESVQTCPDRMERRAPQMKEAEGVTEALKNKREYLGKVDPETQEIIPKGERVKRNHSEQGTLDVKDEVMSKEESDVIAKQRDEIEHLNKVIAELREQILETKKALTKIRDAMEALATGIKRIDDECKKAGVQYEFIKEKYGFTVKFYRHCGEGWGDSSLVSISKTEKKDGKRDGKRDRKKEDEILECCEAVKVLLRQNPKITIAGAAAELGISKQKAERAFSRLQASDSIEHVGPTKGGSWIVKD